MSSSAFIYPPIEGRLQDMGQSLWEMIWRVTKGLEPFGGPSEFSKHLDGGDQVLKQSSRGGVNGEKREPALCSVATFVVQRQGRPRR